jgi:hypothetical protein
MNQALYANINNKKKRKKNKNKNHCCQSNTDLEHARQVLRP